MTATRAIRDRVRAVLNPDTKDERRQPRHLPDQRGLIQELFRDTDPVWLLVLDAGRYDFFDQLVDEYFEGDLRRCWNGSIGYTGDWFERNISDTYPEQGLYSWLPLREQQGPYDGRDHFTYAPDIGGSNDVEQRLAALGYQDGAVADGCQDEPAAVNQAVRERPSHIEGGVVRYLKPHPPFDGLEDITSTASKTERTQRALDDGEISYAGLTAAYEITYRTGFEYARELVPDLEGRVVITADHGTCLTCGQLFHGRHHEKHDHLTVVPWFEVTECV